MNDTRKPRAVSGEIMTDRPQASEEGASAGAASADIIDADYVTLASGQPRDGQRRVRPAAAGAAAAPGLGVLAPRRSGKRARQRGGVLFWTTGIVVVFTAFWVSGGHALVRQAPFQAAVGHNPAVRVASLESRVERQTERSLLFVDGEAVNDAGQARAMPPLSIDVLGNDGRTTRYLLGTNGRRLAPGERYAFSSRLIAPNAGVKSVSVTIQEQQD